MLFFLFDLCIINSNHRAPLNFSLSLSLLRLSAYISISTYLPQFTYPPHSTYLPHSSYLGLHIYLPMSTNLHLPIPIHLYIIAAAPVAGIRLVVLVTCSFLFSFPRFRQRTSSLPTSGHHQVPILRGAPHHRIVHIGC